MRTPEAEAFYNHIFGCRECYAPASNYCPTGAELRRAYYVPAWVADLLRRPTREARAYGLLGVPADLRADVEHQVRVAFAAGYTVPDADYLARRDDRHAKRSVKKAVKKEDLP